METLSFTFGVLSVVVIIYMVIIVVGIVKVVKQQKQIETINDEVKRLWEAQGHSIDKIYQTIDKNEENIYDSINETRSYIDSRIDKLTVKQIIKS